MIRQEEQKASRGNAGCAFIVFSDLNVRNEILKQKWLKYDIQSTLNIKKLHIRPAYSQSDIIWPNIDSSFTNAYIKRTFFFFFTLLICF